jgi:hypothetical protein
MKILKINLIIAAWFVAMMFVAMLVTSCASSGHACDAYGKNSIKNPENQEFVEEVAFNAGVKPKKVTQIMFNQRYSQ